MKTSDRWLQNIESEVFSNFEFLIQEEKISLDELADILSIPTNEASAYLNQTKKINIQVIAALHHYLGISANWLLTGSGDMYDRTQFTDADMARFS